MTPDHLVIAKRFNGPPRSGNGGYVAGLLGQLLGERATVRLTSPPPLDRALRLETTEQGYALLDGDTTVASARAGAVTLTPPPAPDADEARYAARRYADEDQQTFSHCFVCGTARAEGDGLRIFAGPLADTGRVAAPWVPAASLADDQGQVHAEYVWAALDCPGAFAIDVRPGEALLLGEMTAELRLPVPAESEHYVLGWMEHADGRKHYTGTALYDSQGRCLALAQGTWFAVPEAHIA